MSTPGLRAQRLKKEKKWCAKYIFCYGCLPYMPRVHIQQAEAGSWIRGQQSADPYGSKPDK